MKKKKIYPFIFIFLIINLLSSCLPEQQATRTTISQENNSTSDNSSSNENESETRQLEQALNFMQQGSTQTSTTLSLFADYKDTFLIRGNNLISFLKDSSTSSQSNYCVVFKFPNVNGGSNKSILVLSARVRSYYSTQLNSKEYFLQIEPNNETINQNDCLTVSLTNELTAKFSSSDITYKLGNVCPTCTLNQNSNALKLYTANAFLETSVDLSYLNISLLPAIGSTNDEVKTCQINANCTSSGYNCCLSGQCVNHGEVKPGVNTTSSDYQNAIELLQSRPELIVNYTNIFYICPEMVPIGSGTDPDDNIDPIQDATDLFTELYDLYKCTTTQIDEFSICTTNYSNASDLMETQAYNFQAGKDDINFSTISSFMTGTNNIVEINYGGNTIFKEKLLSTDTSIPLPSYVSLGTTNDSFTTAQGASIFTTLPANAANDNISISFKVDGTCEKLGTSLARCKKYYKQGQISSPPRSSDHAFGNQIFPIPNYSDTSFNVVVEVGGSRVTEGTDTWTLSGKNVVFNSTSFPIFSNQEVIITYFVTQNVSLLTASKELAQDKLDTHCTCDPNEKACSLKPNYTDVNGVTKLTSFSCVYPEPDVPEGPLQETVYLSAKTVPHKFYDEFGVNYDLGSTSSPNKQEGTKFEYTNNLNLKPNNISSYIGFNEIYGSMNVNTASPIPPKVIEVEKGKSYDIFVDEGAFSTCLNCGTDYFSSLQKIFPNNFDLKGAGYYADLTESRRTTNQSKYNGDDLRFGRACFVPASMIPWTHVANNDLTTQRRNRLSAQHFLFANGYNKDWYGFDYGSVIGSFDGMKWFAIGNQRRIQAESKKLYLAINAYFGDLTVNNTYKLIINEASSVLNSGSFVTHNLESDGAECQKAHICSSDNDCITNLGYDYVCQNVSGLTTPWPRFDSNGNELSGESITTLLSLSGGSNGEAKRCVYRGVGAICAQRNMNVAANNSYTNSTNIALHSCSQNSTCQNLNTSQFNNKIARFADTALNQNKQSYIPTDSDLFGLGTRLLGRPYKYYGSETPNSTARTQLVQNNVLSLCIPGKDVENANTLEEANYFNTITRAADKTNNVGKTMPSNIFQDENMLSFCPATDDDGNYTHFQNKSLNDSSHKTFAIRNNLSSNLLDLSSLANSKIFNDDQSLITTLGLSKNSCLRAPGAKCFSDFECAPNQFIANKFKSISNFNEELSDAEIAYWEEDLICGSSQSRKDAGGFYNNPLYQTEEHRCCRETNKSFTYYTQKHENSDFEVVNSSGTPLIPGVNQDFNSPKRYSRTNTIYDKLINEPSRYPSMVSASSRPSTPLNYTLTSLRQYNTLHTHNERMCCTGHWVRKFSSGTNANSGGNHFSGSKQQNISMNILKPLTWLPNHDPPVNIYPVGTYSPDIVYGCNAYDINTLDCEIKNLIDGSAEETKYLNWLAKFELIGIPQVLIETNNYISKPLSTEEMDLDNNGSFETKIQQDILAAKLPIDNTIKDVNVDGLRDATYQGKDYYSAASYDNFEMGSGKLKKVFSENEFNCCIPTGLEVSSDTPGSACCTGKVATIDAGDGSANRCCLEDYTNLSVYTNRYVSSEGVNFNGSQINDSDIDATSGFIKKEIVKQMGATMCCSGRAEYGNVIRQLGVPNFGGQVNATVSTRRWSYLEEEDNADAFFNQGLRWNNNVYCVPASLETGSTGGSGSGSDGQAE